MTTRALNILYPRLTEEELISIGCFISFLTDTHHLTKKMNDSIIDCFFTGTLTRTNLSLLYEKGTEIRPYCETMIFKQPDANHQQALISGVGMISTALRALEKLIDEEK